MQSSHGGGDWQNDRVTGAPHTGATPRTVWDELESTEGMTDRSGLPAANAEGGRRDWGLGSSTIHYSPSLSPITGGTVGSPLRHRAAAAQPQSIAASYDTVAAAEDHRVRPQSTVSDRPVALVGFGGSAVLPSRLSPAPSGEHRRDEPRIPSGDRPHHAGWRRMPTAESQASMLDEQVSFAAHSQRFTSSEPPSPAPEELLSFHCQDGGHWRPGDGGGLPTFSPSPPPRGGGAASGGPSFVRRVFAAFCLLNALLAFLFAWMMATRQSSFALMAHTHGWSLEEKVSPTLLAGVYYLVVFIVLVMDRLFGPVRRVCGAVFCFWCRCAASPARSRRLLSGCRVCVLSLFRNCRSRPRAAAPLLGAEALDSNSAVSEPLLTGSSRALDPSAHPRSALHRTELGSPYNTRGEDEAPTGKRKVAMKRRRLSPSVVQTASPHASQSVIGGVGGAGHRSSGRLSMPFSITSVITSLFGAGRNGGSHRGPTTSPTTGTRLLDEAGSPNDSSTV